MNTATVYVFRCICIARRTSGVFARLGVISRPLVGPGVGRGVVVGGGGGETRAVLVNKGEVWCWVIEFGVEESSVFMSVMAGEAWLGGLGKQLTRPGAVVCSLCSN